MSTIQQGLIENANSPAGGLRFVVALKPEADPVIEHFKMKPIAQAGPFRCWANEAGDAWLVISGIGKASSAAASAWLHAVSGADPAAAWVNLGIAGHHSLEPGEIRRIHKVTDAGTGRSWYPPQVIGGKCGIESAGLITVDRPAESFPDDVSLLDMEASGFIETVSRFTSLDLVHGVKVVSDNAETGFEGLKGNRNRVRNLMDSLVLWLQESGFLGALKVAVDAEVQRIADPEEFGGVISRFHFTESQRHQLRRLLVRTQALGLSVDLSTDRDAKTALQSINSALAKSSE